MTLDIYLDSGCVTGTFPQHFSINILSGTNEAHIISLPCEASKCFRIRKQFRHKYQLLYVDFFFFFPTAKSGLGIVRKKTKKITLLTE